MKCQAYELIAPPFTMQFREMPRPEIRAYSNWFHTVLPARIRELSGAVRATPGFDHWEPDETPESLDALGAWFWGEVRIRPRTEEEKEEIYRESPEWFRAVAIPEYDLDDRTFSIAFDIGMYMSQVFLRSFPELEWRIPLTGKRNIDYGQPVLAPFGKRVFNPVRMAVAQAYRVASKNGTADLHNLFIIWGEMIAEPS
jgi:hypothetical protein